MRSVVAGKRRCVYRSFPVAGSPKVPRRSFSVLEGYPQCRQCLNDASVVALEWRDPLGLRGCGFFTVRDGRIAFQRGYWDKLSFLKMHHLPIE
jgi:hypothetical protein